MFCATNQANASYMMDVWKEKNAKVQEKMQLVKYGHSSNNLGGQCIASYNTT